MRGQTEEKKTGDEMAYRGDRQRKRQMMRRQTEDEGTDR